MAGLSEAQTIMSLKGIDSRLRTSVEKTISFVKSLLGDSDIQASEASAPGIVEENVRDTGWYSVDEVCRKYKLPKDKIKSRKWRIDNGFPTHQEGAYSSVRFNATEVEKWLKKR